MYSRSSLTASGRNLEITSSKTSSDWAMYTRGRGRVDGIPIAVVDTSFTYGVNVPFSSVVVLEESAKTMSIICESCVAMRQGVSVQDGHDETAGRGRRDGSHDCAASDAV